MLLEKSISFIEKFIQTGHKFNSIRTEPTPETLPNLFHCFNSTNKIKPYNLSKCSRWQQTEWWFPSPSPSPWSPSWRRRRPCPWPRGFRGSDQCSTEPAPSELSSRSRCAPRFRCCGAAPLTPSTTAPCPASCAPRSRLKSGGDGRRRRWGRTPATATRRWSRARRGGAGRRTGIRVPWRGRGFCPCGFVLGVLTTEMKLKP